MSSPEGKSLLIVVFGPTGVGKTHLSTILAEKLPVEIISADSRQIYKYLNIGTDKPTPEILRKFPHHFIDFIEPDEFFSAGEFGNQARKTAGKIFLRGNIPLVVGGSGLYIRAMIEGFFGSDLRDDKIRLDLTNKAEQQGADVLFEELKSVDEEYAAKTHPNNLKRIVRALEVYHIAGIPISRLHRRESEPAPFEALKFGLNRPREKLYEDINRRVGEMFENGLVEEVKQILKCGYRKDLNSLNTVGYKEVISYLEGNLGLAECRELVKRNSRRYAKRQLTWFRKEKDTEWFKIESGQDYEKAANEIVDRYKRAAEF